LRALIEGDAVLNKLSDTGVTISGGLTLFDGTQSMDWHINMADKQLYRAKSNGRHGKIIIN
jgi:PleD family two-component response regulator